MNFLGHLFFSEATAENQHANLFGDFVKGSDLSRFSLEIQKGIREHRQIDSFIDNHEAVRELAAELSKDLPKVSKIAIDVYFDHFLSLHWDTFSKEKLPDFLSPFYQYQPALSDFQNEYFIQFIQRMKTEKWLEGYSEFSNLQLAFNGIHRRLKFQTTILNSVQVLQDKYVLIETAFFDYMKDALVTLKK